jgi:hypothetical protein
MIEISPQSGRPWRFSDPVAEEQLAATGVVVATIIPEREIGTPMRSIRACARLVQSLRDRDDVVAVTWSRTEVEMIITVPMSEITELANCPDGHVTLDDEVANRVPAGSRTRMAYDFAVWPDEWHRLLPGAERAAREIRASLGGHQCASRPFCLCGRLGNRAGVEAQSRRGELGTVIAAGGRR